MSAHGLATAVCLAALLCSAPAAADEAPSWRLGLRAGAAYVEDERVEALSDDQVMPSVEVGVDWTPFERLWFGASYGSRNRSSDVFSDISTTQSTSILRGGAMYREAVLSWLAVYARGGLAAWWYAAEWDLPETTLEADAFSPGLYVGLGADLLFGNLLGSGRSGAGFGLTVELTYDRVLPMDLADQGTRLGRLDPSGPGFLAGLSFAF